MKTKTDGPFTTPNITNHQEAGRGGADWSCPAGAVMIVNPKFTGKPPTISPAMEKSSDPTPLSLENTPRPVKTSRRPIKSSYLSDLADKYSTSYKLLHLKRKAEWTDKTRAKAAYRPWSSEDLLDRLKTFSYRVWDIPDSFETISPLECAKHGWKTSSLVSRPMNLLECVSCAKTLKIEIGNDPDLYSSLEKKYSMEIADQGHKSNCPWLLRPCDEKVYHLDLRNSHAKIKQRYTGISQILDVNAIDPHEWETSSDDEVDLEAVTKLLMTTEQGPPNLPAMLISLQGWSLILPESKIVQCNLCFAKCQVESAQLKNHRFYCPYRTDWKSQIGALKRPEAQHSDLSTHERLENLRKLFRKPSQKLTRSVSNTD